MDDSPGQITRIRPNTSLCLLTGGSARQYRCLPEFEFFTRIARVGLRGLRPLNQAEETIRMDTIAAGLEQMGTA